MTTVLEIQRKTADFLAGRISLSEFDLWINEQSWGSPKGDVSAEAQMLDQIGLSVWEYSEKLIELGELLQDLRGLTLGSQFLRVQSQEADRAAPVPSGVTANAIWDISFVSPSQRPITARTSARPLLLPA